MEVAQDDMRVVDFYELMGVKEDANIKAGPRLCFTFFNSVPWPPHLQFRPRATSVL
jgi:hypothetical protein